MQFNQYKTRMCFNFPQFFTRFLGEIVSPKHLKHLRSSEDKIMASQPTPPKPTPARNSRPYDLMIRAGLSTIGFP